MNEFSLVAVVMSLTGSITGVEAQEDFDLFEAPVRAAMLPLDGAEHDPALGREIESVTTRLLLDEARYRLMPPWETAQHALARGVTLNVETPERARATAASLGVRKLFRLALGPHRRLSFTVVSGDGEPILATRVRVLSGVPELLDRDVRSLLEQAGVVRKTYRVSPPFRVRAPRGKRRVKSFRKIYPRVVAFLSDRAQDPSRKLALVESAIAAFSGLEDERFDALLAARAQLLAGRGFFGPVSDEHCRAQLDCQRLGRCRGGELTCLARSDLDCRRSEACQKNGRCVALAGECRAAGASCEQSYACRAEGRCEVHAGVCLVPDVQACQHSSQCEQIGACRLSFGACSTGSIEKIRVAGE